MRQDLQRQPLARRERGGPCSKNQERADGHQLRPARLEVYDSAAHRGAGVDHVIDDGGPLPRKAGPKNPWNSVRDRKEFLDIGCCELLGEAKFDIKLLGYHLREERALHQWAAYDFYSMLLQQTRQPRSMRPKASGS